MDDNTSSIYVNYDELKEFSENLLIHAGLDEYSSQCVAGSLLQASVRGIDSHGVMRLPTYLRLYPKMQWSRPEVVEERKATALVDGHNYAGFVCATKAMELAINKARDYGIGLVGVKNSGHFGTACYYSMMALEKNMIGFSFTNAFKRIAPWGGKESLLGINPWSYAIPTRKDFPVVLDISNTAVSVGKMRMAALKGEKIPLGWATDMDGIPTDDPLVALHGLLTPIGDYKGYGISFIMDILCGVLTGSGFADIVQPIESDRQMVGHLLGAIDIEAFMSLDKFYERMDQIIDLVKHSKKQADVSDIFVPGEIEYRMTLKRLKTGIPLPKKLFDELNSMAAKFAYRQLSAIVGC